MAPLLRRLHPTDTVAHGDTTMASPTDSTQACYSETREQVNHCSQGCGPPLCAVFSSQQAVLTVPCVTQWDINVCEELGVEPHTEQPIYSQR